VLFLTAWLLFVYFPFVHMVWGGGLLQQWGVLDFAGGIVVHNIAGMRRWRRVVRRQAARGDHGPHSIPLVALGAGLCSAGTASTPAASSRGLRDRGHLTDIAASFAAVAWPRMDWMTLRKVSDC
jgi:Amt family ammonium transporter